MGVGLDRQARARVSTGTHPHVHLHARIETSLQIERGIADVGDGMHRGDPGALHRLKYEKWRRPAARHFVTTDEGVGNSGPPDRFEHGARHRTVEPRVQRDPNALLPARAHRVVSARVQLEAVSRGRQRFPK